MSGINSISGRADINQVLAEMRNMRSQVQQSDAARPESVRFEADSTRIQGIKDTSEVTSFGDLLSSAVNSVNATSMESGKLTNAYVKGDPGVTLSQVMVQSQKASVSFQALTQVRNKVIQAYEDVMKMPI